jgi:predicted MFS family arabinose efflux permease
MGIAIAGCLYEPCFALVTRSRGVNAKQAIILITLAAGFASTISYPLAHILAEVLGWRGATRVFAAIVIFVVAPTLWLGVRKLEEGQSTRQNKASKNRSTKAFMREPAFWFLAIGFACLAIAHSATLHHLLPILDERNLSAEMAILVASFLGPMQVVGRLAMMASERYFSNFSVAVAAFGLMGLSIAMLLFSASSLTIISGFVILFGGAFGTVSILRPLLAREILGQGNFGAKSGALAMFFLTGLALAPFLGSLLWNLGGYDLMLLALMCFLLLGFILFWQANRLAIAK